MIERRVRHTEFRDVKGGNNRQKWATAVTYNTVDDYGTIWMPGVFDASLEERMPTLLYGHDWDNLQHVLGKGIDKRQTPDDVGPPGVDVLVEFDDPEFVPLARQALYQVDVSKSLRDVSVGFERREWLRSGELSSEQRNMGGKEAMQQASMDELSLVVRGAVVGAQVRSRRMAGTIDLDAVVEIAKRKAAGELTEEQAKAAVDLLVGPDLGNLPSDIPADIPPVVDTTADMADLDAALESIGRSARR